MAGYMIFSYNITDRSQIDELTRLSQPIDARYGAKVIIGSPVKTLEGSAHSHLVVLQFDSFESALHYYHCPEQKELAILRNRITEGWVSVVPGDSETAEVVESGYFKS